MKRYSSQTQPESLRLLFKLLNLTLIILDLIYVFKLSLGKTDQVLFVLSFHSVFLVPSLIIQIFPEVRQSGLFHTVAFAMGILTVAGTFINIAIFFNTSGGWNFAIVLAIFVIFTLPAVIISLSLILMLHFGIEKKVQRVMLVHPDFEKYQPLKV